MLPSIYMHVYIKEQNNNIMLNDSPTCTHAPNLGLMSSKETSKLKLGVSVAFLEKGTKTFPDFYCVLVDGACVCVLFSPQAVHFGACSVCTSGSGTSQFRLQQHVTIML